MEIIGKSSGNALWLIASTIFLRRLTTLRMRLTNFLALLLSYSMILRVLSTLTRNLAISADFSWRISNMILNNRELPNCYSWYDGYFSLTLLTNFYFDLLTRYSCLSLKYWRKYLWWGSSVIVAWHAIFWATSAASRDG